MISLDIESRSELLAYINETPKEADFEFANRECSASCRITSLSFDHETVKGIEVELVELNGLPPEWFHGDVVRAIENKLAFHEDILCDVRGTVQYVLEMQTSYQGDYTGGDKLDSEYEAAEDRKRRTA